ncbi:Heterochromatin protein 1-binding protein 3 [Collichthys lucidus]|uniref:Heterochromatin protein 1-binding protein 3 n=1 Tax=Collichthys lucidus TaxID=240159 RepID=A0A4U5UA35_COLLU|nr:Heterochromatin protein 1-binding protein 3 [Collichthys lucidus]
MPIRRAAATPTQEKPPSAAAEKEPEASSEESPSADDEQAASSAATAEVEETKSTEETAPTENGEEAEGAATDKGEEVTEKKELKDGYKYEKAKVKKVKRTIPSWASVTTSKKVPVSNFAGTQNKVDNILIEAITSCNDKSGVSYQSVMKYIVKKYPVMELDKKKFLIKKALKKHLEKGTIKQLKGKGLSGTFAIGKQSTLSKKAGQKMESLGDALPLIITRLCEPKEASYNLIKKYLEQHFPSLNIESRPDVLKTALVKAVEKGQLEQITGKGARGTFQLKRTGNQVLLKGGTLEDAITAAITAMNEPKTCSTTTLRRYLLDANKDRKEYQLALPSCTQTSSKSFRRKTIRLHAKRRRTADSSDEEESEEEESEDEAPPPKRKPQKRPPPKARRPPPPKKSRSTSRPKAKGRGRSIAKKSPAKKAVSSARSSPTKQSASKESTGPSKATPVKRGAPARKPKTPAVKKLTKRGSKQPVSRDSSPESDSTKETTKSSGSKRSQANESQEGVKKPATKTGSRRPEPEESSPEEPVVKRGAKGSKQSTRKSKRGK